MSHSSPSAVLRCSVGVPANAPPSGVRGVSKSFLLAHHLSGRRKIAMPARRIRGHQIRSWLRKVRQRSARTGPRSRLARVRCRIRSQLTFQPDWYRPMDRRVMRPLSSLTLTGERHDRRFNSDRPPHSSSFSTPTAREVLSTSDSEGCPAAPTQPAEAYFEQPWGSSCEGLAHTYEVL